MAGYDKVHALSIALDGYIYNFFFSSQNETVYGEIQRCSKKSGLIQNSLFHSRCSSLSLCIHSCA